MAHSTSRRPRSLSHARTSPHNRRWAGWHVECSRHLIQVETKNASRRAIPSARTIQWPSAKSTRMICTKRESLHITQLGFLLNSRRRTLNLDSRANHEIRRGTSKSNVSRNLEYNDVSMIVDRYETTAMLLTAIDNAPAIIRGMSCVETPYDGEN